MGVNLDHESVGARGNRGRCQGCHQRRAATGMAGVHDDRQVGFFLQHRDRRHIEGVAGGCLESPYAALAKDHLIVAVGHDVLRRHEQFLDGGGESPLEEHWFPGAAHFGQQGEVLHVAGTDLEHVRVLSHQVHLPGVHHLGDSAKPRLAPGIGQDLEPVGANPLEGVGRGAGLECPAAEQHRAAALHRARCLQQHGAALD